MTAPPMVKPFVLPSVGPVNSIHWAALTPDPKLMFTCTAFVTSLLFKTALIPPAGRRIP